MTVPVSYVELNSPDLAASVQFFEDVFGWAPQPFADPSYLVAPHGDAPGVDAGLLASRDGQPRVVAVLRVDSMDDTTAKVTAAGGAVVVPPFELPGLGRGCYVTDAAGILLGLHEYASPV
jgi:predicted enzyme related to lactoylglutathione lyase